MTEDLISQKAVDALDNSVESLSPEIQQKLSLARKNALEHVSKPTSSARKLFSFLGLSPAHFGARTVVSALVFSFCLVLVFQGPLYSDKQYIDRQYTAGTSSAFTNPIDETIHTLIKDETTATNIESFILLSSFNETELEVIEDLEFAYWLSEELSEHGFEEFSEENTKGDIDA